MTLAIVFHSNFEHTLLVAEGILNRVSNITGNALLLTTFQAIANASLIILKSLIKPS